MALKDLIERFRSKRSLIKEMKDQDSSQELITQLKKSSNERELERFIEEERQKKIKIDLDRFRERERSEQRNMNIIKGRNIFKNDNIITRSNNKLMGSKATILGGQRLFGM